MIRALLTFSNDGRGGHGVIYGTLGTFGDLGKHLFDVVSDFVHFAEELTYGVDTGGEVLQVKFTQAETIRGDLL